MSRILAIESSGSVCSVAMFEDGNCLEVREIREMNSHAELLANYCETLIESQGKPHALSLNTGPGSYTGLRIGVSLVKGLAYGYGIPVIGQSGLACMARHYLEGNQESDWIIPCIDARRMEVYQAVYDKTGAEVSPIRPLIVEAKAWEGFPGKKVLIGDGAEKLQEILAERSDISIVAGIFPSATYQLNESFRKFEAEDFLDLAYFEPVYLKEFQLLTHKKEKYVG
ncbi:MAG TPA: tRNA (adenosine(37)-N6)-threonylcarbamoyltransferase complex dimerization subunit type 1 TsaB [Bacteroidetes bacterium]|nr:tRNA (adenosine(37)-N6)-threonylcarbamoyltransferase complex dimerization subunit type 1 TsaB [Bacteroidota bacterium]